MKVIDGTGATLGRLASFAAKEALLGEEIVIVNCEKVIITGNRADIIGSFEEGKTKIGSGQKGPKYSRVPYMIVKRAVRGMLSRKQTRGKDALRRVMVYEGVPDQYKDSKKIHAGKEKHTKFMHVGELRK